MSQDKNLDFTQAFKKTIQAAKRDRKQEQKKFETLIKKCLELNKED